jgi:hypothetical protein
MKGYQGAGEDHGSKGLEVPEGVGLVFAPPYSPELQPVDTLVSPRSGVRVWPLVGAAGQVRDEDELWERVAERCAYLQTRPDLIRDHTLFHWWPGGC